jgi:hypothetical protein
MKVPGKYLIRNLVKRIKWCQSNNSKFFCQGRGEVSSPLNNKLFLSFASGGQNPFLLQVIGASDRCRWKKIKTTFMSHL